MEPAAELTYCSPDLGRDTSVVWRVLLYVGILHAVTTIVTNAPATIADLTRTEFIYWGWENGFRPLDNQVQEMALVSCSAALACACAATLRKPRRLFNPAFVRATALALAATSFVVGAKGAAFYAWAESSNTVSNMGNNEAVPIITLCDIGSGIAYSFAGAALPALIYVTFRTPRPPATRVARAVAMIALAVCLAELLNHLFVQAKSLGEQWLSAGFVGDFHFNYIVTIASYVAGLAIAAVTWRRRLRLASVALILPFAVYVGWYFWIVWPPERIPPMSRAEMVLAAIYNVCIHIPSATAPLAALILFGVLGCRLPRRESETLDDVATVELVVAVEV
jgi:hypothetical protein